MPLSGSQSRRLAGLVLLVCSSALAGCDTISPSSSPGQGGEGGGGTSMFSSLFGSAPKPAPGAAQASSAPAYQTNDPKVPCPPVDINPGAGAFRLFDPANSTDPMLLRYQATVTRMARECSGMGAELAMRVGIMGRVVTGPKGGVGRIEVPLRVAVVDALNKPVFSQLRMVPVELTAAGGDAEFSYVEENVLVPIDDSRLRGWRVLVGFDEKAAPPKKG